MVHESRSYTRITLALDIVRRIPDGPCAGYHELSVIKHQIDMCDTIRVEEAERDRLSCNQAGVPRDCTNLCLRAAQVLRERFGLTRHVAVSIDKQIPVKGGLAGGSANAATVLLLLNSLWDLKLNRSELMALGRALGMDVPYYFMGGTAFDKETCDEPERIETDVAFDFVLALPRFGISTREAYAGLDYTRTGRERRRTQHMVEALRDGRTEDVVRNTHNDFESYVFGTRPELAAIRRTLLDLGCEAAFMSGSGSTIVGIASSREAAHEAASRLGAQPNIARAITCTTLNGSNAS